MVVENNEQRGMARGAVIVAGVRSGGTFLAHCLSNHPQIFCDRGEPLHHSSVWMRTCGGNHHRSLDLLLNQTGYAVSMAKLTYTQAFSRRVLPYLVKRQPHVLWLRRENVLRQAVSVLINEQARAGMIQRAQHTFSEARLVRVTLVPEDVLSQARGLAAADKRAAAELLSRFAHVLPLTYADVSGGEMQTARELPDETTERVCQFLGVGYYPLYGSLQRVNPFALGEMLSNWRAIEAVIRQSEFAELLDAG